MRNQVAAFALAAAVGAYANKPNPYGGQRASTTTVTYDECPTMEPETIITVTNGVTVTYCPKCEMGGTSFTTVYTTTYKSLCPTGMVPATYTVTESCPGPTPTWTPGPSHIPQGFTVTKKACTVCGEATPTVTVTEPCGCEAHEGTPGPPAAPQTPMPAPPAPTGGSSPPASPPAGKPAPPSGGSSPPSEECSEYEDGQPQCSAKPSPPPAECTEMVDGQPNCSAPAAAPSGNSKPGSGAPPYPTPTKSGEPCSGAECRTMASSAPNSGIAPGGGSAAGNASTPSPPVSPSSASGLNSLIAFSSTAMAVIVAALAFAL